MRRLIVALAVLLSLAVATPAAAQGVRARSAPVRPAPVRPPLVVRPRTILFIGNSFTQGAFSAVRRYRANVVSDLNGDGNGGVPALFKTFTEQARLNYSVALETQGGRDLAFHWNERRHRVDRAWDVVILQDYSTLDRDTPGEAGGLRKVAPMFAAMFRRTNPRVDIQLMATWSRADLTYRPGSPWSGRPITAMATDLRVAADQVKRETPAITGVLPVGEAWSRAIEKGIADPNPYDGVSFGQVNLWTYDQYHGSIYGYYLEALVVFGRVTGVDPRTLGARERAAEDLGISPWMAAALQTVAHDQLAAGR